MLFYFPLNKKYLAQSVLCATDLETLCPDIYIYIYTDCWKCIQAEASMEGTTSPAGKMPGNKIIIIIIIIITWICFSRYPL